ncbi:MAG TPA: tetratricopeptide repeat protein, partial [candidate division Zixibacteria bacterium]|nr:tetratricopeptide repeat protein [candidate division Zixibacteria bacterium]
QDSAEFYLNRVYAISRSKEVQAQLGELYARQRRYEEALPHIRAALKEDPSNPEYLESIGLVHYYLGAVDSSLSYARTLLEADSTNAGSYLLYLMIAHDAGDTATARDALNNFTHLGVGRPSYLQIIKYYRSVLGIPTDSATR